MLMKGEKLACGLVGFFSSDCPDIYIYIHVHTSYDYGPQAVKTGDWLCSKVSLCTAPLPVTDPTYLTWCLLLTVLSQQPKWKDQHLAVSSFLVEPWKCIFRRKIFLCGFYVAVVRLVFWARAKLVLFLRVSYRKIEFHFQISFLGRGNRASTKFGRCIQPARKCLYPICINCPWLSEPQKRFQIILPRAMPRLTRLWWFS